MRRCKLLINRPSRVKLGFPEDQYRLARSLAVGRGVERDEAAAVALYRQAATQGHAAAQYNLALMLNDGQGAPRDEAAAVALFLVKPLPRDMLRLSMLLPWIQGL